MYVYIAYVYHVQLLRKETQILLLGLGPCAKPPSGEVSSVMVSNGSSSEEIKNTAAAGNYFH